MAMRKKYSKIESAKDDVTQEKSVPNKKTNRIKELEDEVKQLRDLSGRGPEGFVPGEHEMRALKSLNLNPGGVDGEYEKPICTVVDIDDDGQATVVVSVLRGNDIDKKKVVV